MSKKGKNFMKKDVANSIRNWINENDMKQKEFAKMAGLGEDRLSQILNGIRSLGRVNAEPICKVTGFSLDWVLYGKAEERPVETKTYDVITDDCEDVYEQSAEFTSYETEDDNIENKDDLLRCAIKQIEELLKQNSRIISQNSRMLSIIEKMNEDKKAC